MQKQLRIITRHRLAVCTFSSSLFPVPQVPSFAFSKHLGRRRIYYRYRGTRVFSLGRSGWFIHCFPSGRRWLSSLPF
jgi:hypothetical protein